MSVQAEKSFLLTVEVYATSLGDASDVVAKLADDLAEVAFEHIHGEGVAFPHTVRMVFDEGQVSGELDEIKGITLGLEELENQPAAEPADALAL